MCTKEMFCPDLGYGVTTRGCLLMVWSRGTALDGWFLSPERSTEDPVGKRKSRLMFGKMADSIYFFFYWRIMALQCCVGFAVQQCESAIIIYIYIIIYLIILYIYIYIYIKFSPSWASLPLPSHPCRSSQSTRLGSLYTLTYKPLLLAKPEIAGNCGAIFFFSLSGTYSRNERNFQKKKWGVDGRDHYLFGFPKQTKHPLLQSGRQVTGIYCVTSTCQMWLKALGTSTELNWFLLALSLISLVPGEERSKHANFFPESSFVENKAEWWDWESLGDGDI